MNCTSVLHRNHLREKRLQFIRAHQTAFDVEPVFPLQLFEDFVVGVEGDCTIEASCKVESDHLIASRFLLFFQEMTQSWPHKLDQAFSFFHQTENQVGVHLDYGLVQHFLDDDFDFSKMSVLSTGIDLRQNLADSSLKMHITIEDYPEKIATAFSLAKLPRDKFHQILLSSVSLIGFDFYLDGRSEIELYASLKEEEFNSPHVQSFLTKNFSDAALKPLPASSAFYMGLSKANENPVLYYLLKNKQELQNYFRLNDMGNRVHSFYNQQEILPHAWVGVAEQELQQGRIENIRLYYYQRFAAGMT